MSPDYGSCFFFFFFFFFQYLDLLSEHEDLLQLLAQQEVVRKKLFTALKVSEMLLTSSQCMFQPLSAVRVNYLDFFFYNFAGSTVHATSSFYAR